MFPNQNPVGQHLSTSAGGRLETVEIVGVVGNTNVAGLRRGAAANGLRVVPAAAGERGR